jgi:hypothetical protein
MPYYGTMEMSLHCCGQWATGGRRSENKLTRHCGDSKGGADLLLGLVAAPV